MSAPWSLSSLKFPVLGWLEPLLDRIAKDPTNVVCPVIDVISDDTLEFFFRDSTGVNVGGFDWNLQFNWHAVPDREKKRHKVRIHGRVNQKLVLTMCIDLFAESRRGSALAHDGWWFVCH